MNAHRQDMVNVELTVEEVRYALECAILSKYPFLDERNGWELNDTSYITKNLVTDVEGALPGAMFYYVKQVAVDIAPLNRECKCANRTDAPVTNCQNNCLKPCK